MADIDYAALKKNGFMRQAQTGYFSMRLRVAGGRVAAEQLSKLTEIAKRYGQGYVHLTSRQNMEIPFIRLEDIDAVKKELDDAELQTCSCGPRVRTVTACQGSAVCVHGLADASALAAKLDRKYYAKELPSKLKLGITGCHNNCLKAEENDIGIKGGIQPAWAADKCVFCGKCAKICRQNAINIDKDKALAKLKKDACVCCGRCVKCCPTGAWDGKSGFIVYFGGMFGNKIAIGEQLLPMVFSEEELFCMIDAALAFFEAYGKPGERLRYVLERTGKWLLESELKKARY